MVLCKSISNGVILRYGFDYQNQSKENATEL